MEEIDQGPVLGSGWIYVASSVITVLAGAMGWSWLDTPTMRWASPILFGVAAAPWAIHAYRLIRLRRALGEATLHLDDAIPMGYSGAAKYVRPLRGAQVRAIEARLQCEEDVVTRGSGSKKQHARKVVYDEKVDAVVAPAMERLELRVPLRIPAAGPSSMLCEVATIKWWLRLRLKMSGCPNTESSFEIEVLPTVVER